MRSVEPPGTDPLWVDLALQGEQQIAHPGGRPITAVRECGTQKAAIATLLAAETRAGGLITTVPQPGHISRRGWMQIGPLGNLDPRIWYALSACQAIAVPVRGAELMHNVHAADVAQAFAWLTSTGTPPPVRRSMWWRRRRGDAVQTFRWFDRCSKIISSWSRPLVRHGRCRRIGMGS
jgi:hypothetical protein